MSEITLSEESPLYYNEDSGDTAVFVTANEYYNIDWGNQPQLVIGTVADLFKNGLEEFLIDRADKYMTITGKHHSFDKIEEVGRNGDNDWNIHFYGEDHHRGGDIDQFDETIPLSILLGDIDAQLENHRKEQAEKQRQEKARREREATAAAARQEQQERATYERLQKKYGGT